MAGRAGKGSLIDVGQSWMADACRVAGCAPGPPIAAAGVRRQYAVQHPAVAVIIGVIYEVGVTVAGFAAGVTGDLAARWRARLVDGLDWTLRSWVSGFDGRYRGLVRASMRFVDLKGLATVGPFTPELDKVFVDVSLAFRPPHLVPAGLLADLPAGDRQRHALGEFLDRPETVVLAVVGAPGSGKTTLLRYTALQACRVAAAEVCMAAPADCLFCCTCVIMSRRSSRTRASRLPTCCADAGRTAGRRARGLVRAAAAGR